MKYFTYKSLYTIIPFVILLFPLPGRCAAGSLESEPEQFYLNFVSGINYQTPQNQLSLMNYLVITDCIKPELDKTNVIGCLEQLAESGATLTVRNHAQLVGLILSHPDISAISEFSIRSDNLAKKDAILLFLKYLNENYFQCGTHYPDANSNDD